MCFASLLHLNEVVLHIDGVPTLCEAIAPNTVFCCETIGGIVLWELVVADTQANEINRRQRPLDVLL